VRLSLFTDYSLRVLMYAALKEEYFQLDEVTAAYRISRNHLAKVVNKLAQAGFLETRRGRGGGICLAVTAQDVRLGALIRMSENEPAILECFDPVTNTCPIVSACKLKGVLAEAMNAFYDSLDRYTLENLVRGPHSTRMKRILLKTETP
jgi:Rrf2 family nitric oxide-sensitive transcriptional repressor